MFEIIFVLYLVSITGCFNMITQCRVIESWCKYIFGESLRCKSDAGQLLEDAVTTAHDVYAGVSSQTFKYIDDGVLKMNVYFKIA